MTLGKKIAKSNLSDAEKADFLQLLDSAVTGGAIFKIRNALNKEIVSFIYADTDFAKDAQHIRKNYKIPRLLPDQDIVYKTYINPQNGNDYTEGKSKWLILKSEARQKRFTSSINNILDRYNLPHNFYDWVEYYILYRIRLPKFPITYYDLLFTLMNNPKMVTKIGLTTEEKKHIRWLGTQLMDGQDIPKVIKRGAMKQLDTLLAKSKNTRRRLKNSNKSIKEAALPRIVSEKVKGAEKGEIKFVKRTKTYKELVAEIDPWTDKETDRKRANLMRKQRANINKRMKKPKLKYSKN
jgi:hypothetical protein